MAALIAVPVANLGACATGLSPQGIQIIVSGAGDSSRLIAGHQVTSSRTLFTPRLKSHVLGGNLSGKAPGICTNLSVSGRVESNAVVQSDIASADTPSVQQESATPRHAADIVAEFYDCMNERDFVRVANLFADECAYEDFNFAEPAKGREGVINFFKRVMPAFGTEFKFVIDDITRDDPNAVGVIWHLDWRGKSVPNSRGCSFYRCEINSSGLRQIKYSRDIVEPVTKPGFIAMGTLRLISALLKRFSQLGNAF